MRSIPRVTGKGAVTSKAIFEFLASKVYQRLARAVLYASCSLKFSKFDLNMASLNKDSSQKYIWDEKSTHLLRMWRQMMCQS